MFMDVTQQPETSTARHVAATNVWANRKVIMVGARSLRERSARSAFWKEWTRQTAMHKRSSAARRVAQAFSADSRREAESVPAVPARGSVQHGEEILNQSHLPVRQTRPARRERSIQPEPTPVVDESDEAALARDARVAAAKSATTGVTGARIRAFVQ